MRGIGRGRTGKIERQAIPLRAGDERTRRALSEHASQVHQQFVHSGSYLFLLHILFYLDRKHSKKFRDTTQL